MITVVVGGTSGMGLEIARHRSEFGDEVILTGRDATKSAEVARRLKALPGQWRSTSPSRRRSLLRWPGSIGSTIWFSPPSIATPTVFASTTSNVR